MATMTFEYCSLHYLNQWLSYDMGFCNALASNDKKKKLDALKKASAFYRIARNLPAKYEEKKGLARYEPVLEIIDVLTPRNFEDNPVQEIRKIEKRISQIYGRGVLSLTTKILWIKIKHPILIYDSRARIALKTKNGDLESYYVAWRDDFKVHQQEIAAACAKLPDLYKYSVNQDIGTNDYIKMISSELWFHERVFDIYLWNKGNNGTNESPKPAA